MMLWLGKIGLKKKVLVRKEYKICFLGLLLKPVFPLPEVCRTGLIYVFIGPLQFINAWQSMLKRA